MDMTPPLTRAAILETVARALARRRIAQYLVGGPEVQAREVDKYWRRWVPQAEVATTALSDLLAAHGAKVLGREPTRVMMSATVNNRGEDRWRHAHDAAQCLLAPESEGT